MQFETGQFDYVIVGAGSAGAVLAARLTEDAATRVLLLEAGGKGDDWLLRMPLGFLKALFKPGYTWPYMSEPEPHLNQRRLFLPRGRLLGGSSSINGMFYMRGHSSDFDRWAQKGASGWSHADVLPYFLKMERHWAGDDGKHGAQGPLAVTRNATRHLLHDQLMEAAQAAGLPITEDIHVYEEGVARGELTIDERGRRASTFAAYLKPAMARPNLTVLTGAQVSRVMLEGKRAIGVAFTHEGEAKQALVGCEVILSGGSYNSPQLLMLSGIGPAEHLRQHGIAVAHDLPGVGQNLSEHPRVPVEFAANGAVTFVNQLRFDRAARHVIEWKLFGTGAFAAQVNSANPILRTDPRLAQPDIQLWCNPVKVGAHLWFPGIKAPPKHEMTSDVILLHPESRGHVELRSADPADKVKIHLNIFSAAADFATARAGIRIARRLYGTEPMAGLVASETLPGPDVTSDEALDEHIRQYAQVTQHPVGTCAIGQGPLAVVDPQLRVHGIAGLRVIDASVMPDVPGGNTNAPTIMIGEKAADMLRGRSLPRFEDHT
ncbi:GMC family oxidoreductase N-terminal domain-containing protein [Altererythrobacter sp. KTW20L]|uniref:GMC family oxidoreductase n=1 Tax=Altererythrobacter sp. KTW20L TaxID=2942210 RepID=UPI0020BEA7CE|nr:GMC family oxidoreductase N-terminal domain-containing protein [Altererythrobacter sp. KTW20L]MCL6251553.1 GMC family oxidoreductase N-terminal domain-containing protein [Altererythrobacter sp. KTW20L]